MVRVKLFGSLRLEANASWKELDLEAASVSELFQKIEQEALRLDPAAGLTPKKLKNCILFVNGERVQRNISLHDGDTVVLLSPSAGG